MTTPRVLLRFLSGVMVLCVGMALRAADQKDAPEEAWDAVFIGSDKVGYLHTRVSDLKENDQDLVEVQVETVMTLKRFGQTIELKMNYSSVETPDGKLLRFDSRALEQHTHGELAGDKMKLTLETLGKKTTVLIPWSDDVLGPNAEDQIIKKEGIAPGQKRSYRSFMPDLNQIVASTIYGEDLEEVTLLDGTKRKLQRLRMEYDDVPALKSLKTFSWIDENRDTIKTHTDLLGGMTTYRVTEEVALAKPSSFSRDLGLSTLIKVDKKIPDPYQTSEVVYKIELRDEDPAEVFPQDERQTLSKGENGEVLLAVRSIAPPPPAESDDEPGAEFLRANNWLQTDNAKVIQAARDAVGGATDPWEKAKRVEKWVFQHITEKDFSIAFDTAAQVAEKLEGDCTEHAVLLAAMARVAGVPSRGAMGLVYAERLGVFGYHMWAEVYVRGRWVPLDGTLGLGHASPAHIKLADSSLEGVDAIATFLPVARVLDRLKIEVVSWKHPEADN